ncbi:MAG: rhomboid family intramembrane serine protease [Pseudomonadota bacterium]
MSILCPNCGKLISEDEHRCPYCGISSPGSRWRRGAFTRTYLNQDNIIKTIIIINALLFTVSILLSSPLRGISANLFLLFSPSQDALLLLGATGTVPIDQFQRWWTLISASYLHGGILHIFFNMAALSQIGPFILREYGLHRWIIIYTIGGAIGFFVSYVAGVPFTIGASASICALIGSALYYGKSRGGVYGETIYKQLIGWVIGLFLFGLLVSGVNNWGHGGGILGGIFLGYSLGYNERKAETYFHKRVAAFCIMGTAVILLWALLSSFYYRFLL